MIHTEVRDVFGVPRPGVPSSNARRFTGRWSAAIAVVLLLAACAAPPSSTATPPSPTATTAAAATPTPDSVVAGAAILASLEQQGLFGGAVLVAQNGEVLHSRGYGLADSAQGVPNTPQTKFALGGVTKQFTAMAILLLEAQGQLDVQGSVCDYIPDCPAQWRPITLHHLLTHTSGIQEVGSSTASAVTVDNVIRQLADLPLSYSPGTQAAYSESGYFLLGHVIEQVSGQSYGDFLQQHIFDPLGMADSGYLDNREGLAIGYFSGGTDPANIEEPTARYAGGGLYSTIEDMFRWDQALYTERLVPQAALDRMFSKQADYPWPGGLTYTADNAYGYGWVVGTTNDHPVFLAQGWTSGHRAFIERHVDDRLVIIVLTNRTDVDPLFIAKLLRGYDLQ